jgi:hypothetical protein
MTDADKKRARSMLVSLMFAGGSGQARGLRTELETVHGIAVTLDRVRADLSWLADVGLIQRINDTVALTEEGRETATGLRALP